MVRVTNRKIQIFICMCKICTAIRKQCNKHVFAIYKRPYRHAKSSLSCPNFNRTYRKFQRDCLHKYTNSRINLFIVDIAFFTIQCKKKKKKVKNHISLSWCCHCQSFFVQIILSNFYISHTSIAKYMYFSFHKVFRCTSEIIDLNN